MRAKNIQEEVTVLRERISFLKNIIMAITKVISIKVTNSSRAKYIFFLREYTTPSRRLLRERKRKNWRKNRSRRKNREGTPSCPKISTLSMTPTFSREARPRASVPTFPGARHFSCLENSDFILCLDLKGRNNRYYVRIAHLSSLGDRLFFSEDILNSTEVLIYLILMRIGVVSNNSEPIIIMLH